MAHLFEPFALRDVTLKNRVAVSPMQTYSAPQARLTPWHLAHLARFALGGAGLVMVEATAVTPEGRSTRADLGLWDETQEEALAGLVSLLHDCGAAVGIQLQHAGRKAASTAPWDGFRPMPAEEAWEALGPTPVPTGSARPPRAMTREDMAQLEDAYATATRYANAAGVDLVEIHMAHGYLLHSFLSPLSNTRDDDFGGSLENRMRFPLRVAQAVRAAWPSRKPLACRISCVDGVGIGWSLEESEVLACALMEAGVDLIDCSSGGMDLPHRDMLVPRGPSFQVPFARHLRRTTGAAVMAVGGITLADEAEAVVAAGDADLVAIGRQMLADPNWTLNAARALLPDSGWEQWPQPFGWWLRRRAAAAWPKNLKAT